MNILHSFSPSFTWTTHEWRLAMIAALADANKGTPHV